MEIKLLKRDEIETGRWNGCVHYAGNSKIYGYTWYLDNVCGNDWYGLVEGNYESVFPLVWNSKLFNIKQLYQPYLCQQLGLFSVNVLSKERIKKFLAAIPDEFKYWEMHLNDANKSILNLKGDYTVVSKDNYLLYLNKPYAELHAAYSKNTKRNIKKAVEAGLYLTAVLKPETFVEEVKKAQEAKSIQHPEALYHTAHRIIYNCLHRGQGAILAAYDSEKNLCAGIFLMFNGSAIVNLLNFSTVIGKELGAMAYLLDSLIQREADKYKYIDFEGSSVEGIARFYKSFGAENVPYYHLKRNKLPWFVKWTKK